MNEQRSLQVQQKRTVADLINSPKMRDEIAKVLPKHLTPERMTRVALTATMKNPALLECTPESLTNALLTCSQAGLEPDGRLAHLIPYGKVVQVIFDYKGLVTLALRNGAESVYADKVCEFDAFDAFVDDGIKKLNHKPSWKGNRGTAVCYYAVCKRGGEVDWEVMSVDEVQTIRERSRAKGNGPWVTDFDEMAKKTVLRRMSKRWDLLPEIRDVINADDDTPPPFGQVTTSRPIFETPKALPKPEPEAPGDEPQTDAPEQEPEPAGGGESGEPQPELLKQPAAKNGSRYLKAVRALCGMAHIKEGELMDYLGAEGVSDGSPIDQLDESVLRVVHDCWSTPAVPGGTSIVAAVMARRKGGK